MRTQDEPLPNMPRITERSSTSASPAHRVTRAPTHTDRTAFTRGLTGRISDRGAA